MTLSTFLISFLFCLNTNTFSGKKINAQDCEFSFSEYSSYWKKDSVGAYGARYLLATYVWKKCLKRYIGKEWNHLSGKLGVENYSIDRNKYMLYRYNLTNYGRAAPGQMYLEVKVNKNNKIIGLNIDTVDG